MNRIALFLLFVATLAGCGGGSKSVPNTPDPGPVIPTPISGGLAQQSKAQNSHLGGTATIGNNSGPSTPVHLEVDWIELLTPPFVHGETERFLLHLATPGFDLIWYTASANYVDGVKSDKGGTIYNTNYSAEQPIYEALCPFAGQQLRCVPTGYKDVTIKCTIKRFGGETVVSSTFFPLHAPPRSGGVLQFPVAGVSGEECTWTTGYQGLFTDILWNFGEGASPNTAHGQPVQTILGPPGRYTASYTIRNEWGFGGPQQIGYWVQPPLLTHPLNFVPSAEPSLLVVDDRIRMLLPMATGYQYGEALVAVPLSASDWRFSALPLPATHTSNMRMGMHNGKLLIVGGQGESGSDDVALYYRASVLSPQRASDWDVGGIPDSDSTVVLDVEIEPDRVGLLVRQSENLLLLWDASPTLSQWRFSEIANEGNFSNWISQQLMLTETGPVVVGSNLLDGEPSGLMYRSANWDAPDSWSAHRIPDVMPLFPFGKSYFASIYQERPLVLAALDSYSSALLRSAVPCPTRTEQWERLETSEFTVQSAPSRVSIHVNGDQIVISPISIEGVLPNRFDMKSPGGLLIAGDPADLAHWTPFLPPNWIEGESIVATVLTNDGAGVLSTDDDGLRFGMLSP